MFSFHACHACRSVPAALVITVLFVLLSTSCRPPVVVEGGLHPDVFQTNSASLTKDFAGRLFAVAARGQSPGRFVLVEHDEQSHLFFARSVGARTAQLFPLTRFDIEWYNDAMGQRRIDFLDELDGLDLSDSIGLWRGGSQESIRWLGPAPTAAMRAVAISIQNEPHTSSLASEITGTLIVDNEGVVERHDTFAPHRGPFIVLLDGPITDIGPRVASLTQTPIDPPQSWTLIDGQGNRELSNAAVIQQRAGELGVEIIIGHRGDHLVAGFGEDAGVPGVGPVEQRPAIAESGLLLPIDRSTTDRRKLLQVLDDLYGGHTLSAAFRLAHIEGWSVDASPEASRLRHQDLIAAAGFAPWARSALLDGKEGIAPEVSFYLGRAFYYRAQLAATRAHANRALSLFSRWPAEQGALGQARSLRLLAKTEATAQDLPAAISTLAGAEANYLRGGDPFQAAIVARSLALLEPEDNDFLAIQERLSDIGATYEASRTLLLAASAFLEQRELQRATNELDRWQAQFANDDAPRLKLLHRALQIRARQQAGESIDRAELTALDTQAAELHAWEALLSAGLSRHDRQSPRTSQEIRTLATQLLRARRRGGVDLFAAEARHTLGVLCTDLAFTSTDGVAASVDLHCRDQIDGLPRTSAGIETLLEAGYRFMQRGQLSAAHRLFETLADAESTLAQDEILQARVFLFQAALLDEQLPPDEEAAAAAIQRAFDVLREHLSPRQAPSVLRDFGDEFTLRGFDRQAIVLYGAARQAAANANHHTAEFDATLLLARALYTSQRWRELADLPEVDSPLHAARIRLYRAHAHGQRDNRGSAQELRQQSLTQAQEFGGLQRIAVFQLAANLAMDSGDFDEARAAVDRADAALDELPDSLAGREDAQVLRARSLGFRAALNDHDGQPAEAVDPLQRALQLLEELPPEAAPAVRHEILKTGATHTHDVAEFRDYLGQLEALLRRLTVDEVLHRREITATIAELYIQLGQLREAADAIDAILASGQGIAATRALHHCAVGQARLHAADFDLAAGHLQRCVDKGGSPLAEGAQFLSSLADPEANPAYRAGLARHLLSILPDHVFTHRARLAWMAQTGLPTIEADEAHESALRDAFQAAAQPSANLTPTQRLSAAVTLVEYLINSAQFSEADAILQSNASIFYDHQVEGRHELVRLRVASLVHQLRPFDVFGYIDRAVVESPPPNDEAEARIFLLRAMAYLQAGQFFPAAESLRQARNFAPEENPILEEIESLESTLRASRSAR